MIVHVQFQCTNCTKCPVAGTVVGSLVAVAERKRTYCTVLADHIEVQAYGLAVNGSRASLVVNGSCSELAKVL